MNIWIFILIIAAMILVLLLRRIEILRQAQDKVVGICAAAIGLDAKKRENKKKILTLLAEKKELSNSDIREALGVADRTVIRYMDELEWENKVKQIGSTGRGVTYILKQ